MFRTKDKNKTSTISPKSANKRISQLMHEHDAIPCGDVIDRTQVRCIGEVMSTRIVPRGMSHWFEIVISDGTGKINGWFFGRKKIDGMTLGSVVLFEGLVQLDQGEHTIANPYYEFL